MPSSFDYVRMKDFRILQNCSICGEGFDSDYKLTKHVSASHPQNARAGWVGAEEDSCGCGGERVHSELGRHH
ncbi:MAG TPA: hypothetical protein VIE86_00890 [Nitrososphaera sp.]